MSRVRSATATIQAFDLARRGQVMSPAASQVGTHGPRLRRDTLRAAWSDRVTVEFARWGSTYGHLYGEGEA
jgi:hypothetical protein